MNRGSYSNLSGKTALVTGAGLGIGAALSIALGELGADVICASRTQSDIDRVAQTISDAGSQALAVATDVTNVEQTLALADAIDEAFGGLDVAFLNAGGNWQRKGIEESDIDDWKAAIELNLFSVFYGIRAVAPLMRKRGGGRIILTGSAMAHYPAVRNSSYCVAKAGARMLANTAAQELMADNITVNEFIPGPTRTLQALDGVTEDNKASPFNNPAEWVKEPEEVVDMMLTMAAYPGMGPTSQIFSLARR
ncbi:MAG: SDR family NAD(P)-dependent oxidoreductase [Hyphomicrobiaceae bacterium]